MRRQCARRQPPRPTIVGLSSILGCPFSLGLAFGRPGVWCSTRPASGRLSREHSAGFRDVADVIISTLVISPRKPPVAPLGGASLFVNRNLVRPRYAAPNDSIRVLGTCSSLSTTGRREPVQSDASTLVVLSSAHVHGNSMMGYAIGRDANHLTERKWQRPLQGTRRGGTHGGGQSRLLLTPSNQAHR